MERTNDRFIMMHLDRDAGRSKRARTVFDDATTRATRGMTDERTDGWTDGFSRRCERESRTTRDGDDDDDEGGERDGDEGATNEGEGDAVMRCDRVSNAEGSFGGCGDRTKEGTRGWGDETRGMDGRDATRRDSTRRDGTRSRTRTRGWSLRNA